MAQLPPHQISATTWLINSSFVRKNEDEDGRYGTLPLLTLEDQEKARKAAAAKRAAAASPNPPPSHASGQTAVTTPSGGIPADAYAAYQETMREFLRLQESIMKQFAAGAPQAPAVANPPYPAVPP
ncbi:MAG: hypothetical protein ACQKBT_04540, partial [Puniceicoccales bacterium]